MTEQKRAFVITAPSEDRRALYDAVIKPLFEDTLRWECVHLDDCVGAGNKVRDLVSNITDATLVIVDLTEIQGDVFYELGIAHVLSNRVLTLVCKGRDTTPSHLKTYQVIEYEDSAAGGSHLRKKIIEAVHKLPAWSAKPSNPIHDVLPAQWFDNGEALNQPAFTQTFLDQQQKLETALTEKIDQMQGQMFAKLAEMARTTNVESGVIDMSLLNKQIDELRTELDEMSFKRKQAESYLTRLTRDRDGIVQQMGTVARTLESDRVLLTSPHDDAAQIFVPAALMVPGPRRANEAERQQAERFVKAFYMDVFPVTNDQFRRFVVAKDYITIAEQNGSNRTWRTPDERGRSLDQRMDHPVVYVHRADALAYARWAGRRLPTRLEWERAMRGVDGQTWPWGEEFDVARCNLNSDGTTPVRAYPGGASPTGCRDMVGNVWEWLADELPGGKLVLMGGSWDEAELKVGYKLLSVPDDGTDGATGFRCAMDVFVADSR